MFIDECIKIIIYIKLLHLINTVFDDPDNDGDDDPNRR